MSVTLRCSIYIVKKRLNGGGDAQIASEWRTPYRSANSMRLIAPLLTCVLADRCSHNKHKEKFRELAAVDIETVGSPRRHLTNGLILTYITR